MSLFEEDICYLLLMKLELIKNKILKFKEQNRFTEYEMSDIHLQIDLLSTWIQKYGYLLTNLEEFREDETRTQTQSKSL